MKSSRVWSAASATVMTLMFLLSGVACSPNNVSNYITANGADKKLPDDDGYTGSGGTGDGGGGQGVLCSDKTVDLRLKSKIFTRDIFELIYNSNAEIVKHKLPSSVTADVSDEAISLLIGQLSSYLGPSMGDLEFGNRSFWKSFVGKIAFLDKNTSLQVSKDANSPIVLPNGCKIVQIAFWDDQPHKNPDGTLYVQTEYWSQLDQLNKIALLAHEYFFKEARQAGYKNSDFIRGKIGRLFSAQGLTPLFSKWIPAKSVHSNLFLPNDRSEFKHCSGTIASDPSSKVVLYQYSGADKKQHVVIPLLKTKFLTRSTFAKGEFDVQEVRKFDLEQLYMDGRSALKYTSDEELDDTHYLNLKFYGRVTKGQFGYRRGSAGEIWQDYIDIGGTARKVSIVMPEEKKWVSLSVLDFDKEQVSKYVVAMIKSAVAKKLESEEVRASGDDLEVSAFIALKKDVDEAVKNGSVKNGFTLWKNELDKFENKYAVVPHHPRTDHLVRDKYVSEYLPLLLLKNELNMLEQDDLNAIENFFNPSGPTPSPNLEVEIGNDKTIFDLECKDYDTVYADRMRSFDLGVAKKSWEGMGLQFIDDVKTLDEAIGSKAVKFKGEFLKLLEERARNAFEGGDPCADSKGYCTGSQQLYRIFAYEKSRSLKATVRFCGDEDNLRSSNIWGSNQNIGYVSQFACYNIQIGDTLFFQVFMYPEIDAIEKSKIYVIPVAPPDSYIKSGE
ncbi:hypothetical protein AZI86_16785 [Bdellovibrio bacteriovorus]|uniref:Uncharacterized protein n=1 Tax=Bdellovibrio bacteriovorus TaxID=959 RepID=A0A150WHI2_BDEBC|nr:hypothetical protein [Bdellovibrio bacteriovorus]KYG62488.1 hypothetical protein AZI86_16785 [Bdellovibrio bacteriovorus]